VSDNRTPGRRARDASGDATVLVADDDGDVADLYATRLQGRYEVRVAYGGTEALEALDGGVDVFLLDRQMPGLAGDEVLERVRERGLDVRVVMVTPVTPDFDIIEMPFDDYLVKPVTREDVTDAVATMLARASYDETLREYFALAEKKATLEAEKPVRELEESERYAALTERVRRLETRADVALSRVSDDYEAAFREAGAGD
jgi:DNA-binding response OmpR family regulator